MNSVTYRVIKLLFLMEIIIISPVSSQAPVLSESDTKVYYGFEYGAAGIINALLDYFNKVDESVETSIKKGIESLWNARYSDGEKKIAIWQKSNGSELYPGVKYGTAGIVNTFIKAYEILKDDKYLRYAEDAMKELYSEAKNNTYPRWSYSYSNPSYANSGIVITDTRYGSVGVINAMLDIYRNNADKLYLGMAINATRFLINTAKNYTIGDRNYGVLSWYVSDSNTTTELTSLMHGNAGLMKMLDRLYKFTGNTYYAEWRIFIASWLINYQNDNGSWYFNINDGNVSLSNFDLGVAGILHELVDIDVLDTKPVIKKGISWLESIVIYNKTHTIIPEYPKNNFGWTSINRGLMGLLKSYGKLYDHGYTEVYTTMNRSYSWLFENGVYKFEYGEKEYYGIVSKSIETNYLDLSYGDGMAGILSQLINFRYSIYSKDFPYDQNLMNTIFNIKNILIDFQDINGLWSKQIVPKTRNLSIYMSSLFVLIPILIILLVIYKKS